MNNDPKKVRAALQLLPRWGEHVTLTLDNSDSVLKKGPLADSCPDTYMIEGKVNAKPGWDRNPDNFAVIVPHSPVQLRIISIHNVVSINGTPTFLKTGRAKRVTIQTFIIDGSKPGVKYKVKFDGTHWTCDCPAGNFRRNCRHVEKAREAHAKNHKS